MLSLNPLHDIAPLKAALIAAKLPADDLEEPGRRFFAARNGGSDAIGFGGFEGTGADLLLRSVVVTEAARGKGAGRAIVAALEAEARKCGAKRLWLLTIDAADFFRGLGYGDADRATAPQVVTGSLQFTILCPGSAKLLVKAL